MGCFTAGLKCIHINGLYLIYKTFLNDLLTIDKTISYNLETPYKWCFIRKQFLVPNK